MSQLPALVDQGASASEPGAVRVGRVSLPKAKLWVSAAIILTGCSAEITVIPSPIVVSMPKSAVARQTLFHLGQRASDSVKAKNRSIVVRQAFPALKQKASGTIPGEFSQEYSDEYR